MVKALLAGVALLASAGVQAEWQQASSRHFVVYADDTPDKVRALSNRLEVFDGAMRVLLGAPDPAISPAARVTVFVARDENDVRRILGRGSADVAGFYIARATGSVAFVPRQNGSREDGFTPLVVLFHEYAHHMMYSAWGQSAIPAWLVEGFAEFAATARTQPKGGMVFGFAPEFRASGLLDYQTVPVSRLLTETPRSLSGREAQTFYGRAWLLTHYLLLDPARRRQFAAYVAAINNGATPVEAAKALGPLPALEAALNAYAGKFRLSGFEIPADKLVANGAVEVRALTTGEAATMPARLMSARGVNARTAPEVAALARRLATPFATDAGAQTVLAEAEFDNKDYPAAEAAAARALAAEPTSVSATLYRSMARMAAARAAKSIDAAQWQAIRTPLMQVNRRDPENPWPLILYYQSFAAGERKATKNAEDGLLYAHALAPFDNSLGLTAARIRLDRGEADAARTVLRPIAFNPHGGAAAAMAGKVLAAIDSGGPTAGLAVYTAAKPTDLGDEKAD